MKTRLSDVLLEGTRSRSTARRGRGKREGAATPAIARWLRANSGMLTFAGLTLGVFVSRKFLILPLAAMAGLCADGLKTVVQRASEASAR